MRRPGGDLRRQGGDGPRAGEIAKAKGVKRAIPLSVSAPFHCPADAARRRCDGRGLAKVSIRPLAVPVLANVTAQEASEPETVRRLLVEQVTGRVRWRESMLALRERSASTRPSKWAATRS